MIRHSVILAAGILLVSGSAHAGRPGAEVEDVKKDPDLVANVVNRLTFQKPEDWRALTPRADGVQGVTVLINYAPLEEAHGVPPAGHVKVELRVAGRGGRSLPAWSAERQQAMRLPGFVPDPARTTAARPYRLAGRDGFAYASFGPGRLPSLNLDLDWERDRALVVTIVPADSPALAEALAALDTVRDAGPNGTSPSISSERGLQLARALKPLLEEVPSSEAVAATCNGPAGTFDLSEAPQVAFTLQMPFPSESSWEVGGIGSYFGNGCHINLNNDYYATDWNRRNTGCAAGYLEDDGFEVRPVAAGIVRQSDCNDTSGYGCQVLVEHTNGQGTFRTRYAHLQQTSLVPSQVGQQVGTGTLIGRVGCSGLPSCGPHLHLSLQQSVNGTFYSRCNGPASSANCPNGLAKSWPQTVKPSPIQTSSGSASLTDGACYTSGNGGGNPPPGWTQTLDDSNPACGLHGPPQYWFTATGWGINNQMRYTWNSQGPGSNYVFWNISVPQAGSYRVEVYVPGNHATTTSARYYVWGGSSWLGPYVVNQNNFFNAWVTLATLSLPAGGGTVYLGDTTGEPTGTRKVGVDAVRLTRQ